MSTSDPSSAESGPWAEPFWLSHHTRDEADRCFRFGALHVCSRCLGTYPVLLLVLVAQLAPPFAPLVHPLDGLLLFALPLPAVVDWLAGMLLGWRGHNGVRLATGLLLGTALGRALYLNMRHPAEPRVLALFGGLVAVALLGVAGRALLRPKRGSSEDAGPSDPPAP